MNAKKLLAIAVALGLGVSGTVWADQQGDNAAVRGDRCNAGGLVHRGRMGVNGIFLGVRRCYGQSNGE
ncbi:hypothetical protein [Marinobacter sp. ELB17]|uniref:hypothetical protein n=1 Tax=Marinobacter sp. ELB17 TaxID=270374 RepID=UPI00055C19D4|nr:hypothetical protein [Marinobacter sp. ELB17]